MQSYFYSFNKKWFNSMNVLGLSQGKLVPSSRFRLNSLINELKYYDINLHVTYPLISAYPPVKSNFFRIFWFILEFAYSFLRLQSGNKFDAVILQRELISTFATFEHLLNVPIILDVDDAVWLSRDGNGINKIAKNAKIIVCGNKFIADYFSQKGHQVVIIPTSVDTDKYKPNLKLASVTKEVVIGWSGTSGGFQYLYDIETALINTIREFKDLKIRIISDKRPAFKLLNNDDYEFVKWTPENEVSSIQGIDIGIMPILRDDWSNGKCSYKMLLYMACGKPVIATDFGMNNEVLSKGNVGIGVNSAEDWYEAFVTLIKNSELRKEMGRTGRFVIEQDYSSTIIAEKLATVLKSISK